ncbi:MAG: hypothetical protein OXJ52_05865 [Oligoflexia bacterium]|nr:hypothetical protein [Oligoflexia bacterium]
MSILSDIQQTVTNDQNNIAPILLKLRFLASKLDSEELDSWIQYESEGYPNNVDIPSYRTTDISFKADFAGPAGSGIKNAPIPDQLVKEIAGELGIKWLKYQYRRSISEIENLLSRSQGSIYKN